MNYSENIDLTKFECKMCGKCCRIDGFVRLTEEDIKRISNYLKISEEAFINQYTTVAPDRLSLILKDTNGHDCCLLTENGCLIHPVKPEQCKGFPDKWISPELASICEGMKELRRIMKNEE